MIKICLIAILFNMILIEVIILFNNLNELFIL
jgi:hypothetical protein